MRPDSAEVAAVYRCWRRRQHFLRVDGSSVARRAAPREGERPAVHDVVRRHRRRGVREVPVGRRAVGRGAVDGRRHRLQAGALALLGSQRSNRLVCRVLIASFEN